MALRILSMSQHSLYSKHQFGQNKEQIASPCIGRLKFSLWVATGFSSASGLLIKNLVNIFLSPEGLLLCLLASLTVCGSCQLQKDDVGHGYKLCADQAGFFKLYADKKNPTCQPQTVLNFFTPVTGFLLPFHCIRVTERFVSWGLRLLFYFSLFRWLLNRSICRNSPRRSW